MNKKAIGSLVAASMLLGSLSGCSLLGGGKDAEAISEAADSFISNVVAGKADKAVKSVQDSDEAFLEAGDFGGNEDIAEALLGSAEYEIDSVEGKAKDEEGSADIVFTWADLDTIVEDGMTKDELIEALKDPEETTEESFTLELVYDDEEWFVSSDSAVDFMEFLADQVADVEVGGLSEEAALAAVDEFVGYLNAGDMDSALAMSVNDDLASNIEEDGGDPEIIIPALGEVYKAYFTQVDYESSVIDSSEDSVTVQLTGTAPYFLDDLDAAISDVDTLAPLYAPIFGAYINGASEDDLDPNDTYLAFIDILSDTINGASSTTNYNCTVVVTADEDGNLLVDPDDDFFSVDSAWSFEVDDSIEDELVIACLDILLADGTITQSDYDMYAAMYGGSTVAPATTEGISATYTEGTNFWTFSYDVKADYLEVTVRTYSYNTTGDIFEYDILIDGQPYCERAQYVIPGVSDDTIIMTLPFENGTLAEGTYEFILYDIGAGNTDVVCDAIITSGGVQGAPSTTTSVSGGDYPVETNVATGSAGTVDGDSSTDFLLGDFYSSSSFNSYNSSGTYTTSNSGIYFQILTWDYHNVGDTFYYGVYCNGVNVDGGTFTITDEYQDDDVFISYEPSALVAGDYTIIVYQANSTAEMCRAYAKVQ
ncbi:MAG: hypothetical protein J5883_03095 [Clostridiales bacterium]|nr:hypothetical protein [Clostridiales bacterium]